MSNKFDNAKQSSYKQNILFYDELASDYNSILGQEQSNKIIRQKVAEKFCSVIKAGSVLDFGGGTGLDLKWLTEKGYKIFFCEPSGEMRRQAINYNNNTLHNQDIVFLDDAKTNFKIWSETLPFSNKVDAILMNFAVINNIAEIELLFKNLSLVLNTGCHLIALILDNSFKKLLRTHLFSNLISVISQKPVTFYVQHNEYKQIVYIHTTRQIKKASDTYFNFQSIELLSEFGFALIHLTKK